MKKLWLLEAITAGNNLWDPWYDKALGFVVCAATEEEARQFAQDNGGDEVSLSTPAWTDPQYSTCEQLVADNEWEGVIIRDFAAA